MRKWSRKARERARKGDILFTKATIVYTKALSNKVLQIRQTASMEFQCKMIVLCQQQIPPFHTLDYLFKSLFHPFTIHMSNNALSEQLNMFYQLKSPKTTHTILGEYRFF